MPGPPLRALVADDDDVALLDLLARGSSSTASSCDSHDDGRALEGPDRLVDAGGLHDAAVLGEVAVEDGQAAVLGVGVRDVADAAARGVGVEGVPALGLREGGRRSGRSRAPRGTAPRPRRRASRRGCPSVLSQSSSDGGVHGVHVLVEQPAAVELAEDGGDAAGAVHVLHVVRAAGPFGATLARQGTRRETRVDVRHGRSRARPPGRRPAGAGSCWWSRPWRCRGPWRSRRRRGWRWCAAGRCRRPARSSAW